jgi:hypothetical protein
VSQCDIFGFFTLINPVCVGDQGLEKIVYILKIEAGSRHFAFEAHAECALKI